MVEGVGGGVGEAGVYNTQGQWWPKSSSLWHSMTLLLILDIPPPQTQLSDRFLRLLLQLAKRYSTWVGQVLASRANAAVPDAQQQQQQPQGVAAAATSSEGGGLSPDGAASSGPPPWAAQLPVEDLAVFMRDLKV